LANRLGRLVDAGILTREPCPEDRRKIEYRLTEKGLDLLPTMIALRQWGEKWETCTPSNPVLVDKRDLLPVADVRVHAHDGRPLKWEDLSFRWREELEQAHAAE
ncbi:MAG TPA: winged helix-turn-helix transcriptional regulator, partial [Sphingomonas sp.]|nr:winged helix-turn-helix transcriptional regulator [Sphingomonas sp.]